MYTKNLVKMVAMPMHGKILCPVNVHLYFLTLRRAFIAFGLLVEIPMNELLDSKAPLNIFHKGCCWYIRQDVAAMSGQN